VTTLFRNGAQIDQAQQLARHSTPVLTTNIYNRVGRTDLAAVEWTRPQAAR
jgi:site-specific recombinase XerD